MARFAVHGELRNDNIEAGNAHQAVQQATAQLQAVLPPGWTLLNMRAAEPALQEGEFVYAFRDVPGGHRDEGYARVIKGPGGPGAERQLEFGDGHKQGMASFSRRVE